jgi:riboflavin synthase
VRLVFTGLVQATGTLEARTRRASGFRLAVRTDLSGLEIGESINVSGACLTVVQTAEGRFEADLSSETAAITTLGRLPFGSRVNLERAVRLSDRLGGHLVSGHVDTVVKVKAVEPAGEARQVEVALPSELRGLVAPKGSVALDGVSLTVNQAETEWFSLMLIPQTLASTSLNALRPEQELNLEVDLIARYAARWLEVSGRTSRPEPDRESDARLEAALRRTGWM